MLSYHLIEHNQPPTRSSFRAKSREECILNASMKEANKLWLSISLRFYQPLTLVCAPWFIYLLHFACSLKSNTSSHKQSKQLPSPPLLLETNELLAHEQYCTFVMINLSQAPLYRSENNSSLHSCLEHILSLLGLLAAFVRIIRSLFASSVCFVDFPCLRFLDFIHSDTARVDAISSIIASCPNCNGRSIS
jgi:hypothetical protein